MSRMTRHGGRCGRRASRELADDVTGPHAHPAHSAKLNAETEHQTTRDSTQGEPEPPGKRGADLRGCLGPISSAKICSRYNHGLWIT